MTIDWTKVGTDDLPQQMIDYLADRGVSARTASLNNLRALTAKEMQQLGWRVAAKSLGLLFPGAGQARILQQDERLGKFRFMPGGARMYVPVQPGGITFDELRKDTGHALIAGEGPTRALAATQRGYYAISLPGCWHWQRNRRALPELRRIRWKNRTVYPVFDADAFDNSHVGLSYILFGDWLSDQGAAVYHLQLPKVAGRTTGLDDLLAAKGRKGFKNLVKGREKWNSRRVKALRIETQRRTEGGLGALFAMQNADDVRFIQDEGEWLVYNGHLFQRQGKHPLDLEALMQRSVAWILRDASTTTNKDRRKALLDWHRSVDRVQTQVNALRMARSDFRIRIRAEELDADPYLLGVLNGVLDLRTGALTEATRSQLVTRSMAATFDPSAKCERWEKFLSEIMLGDAEMVKFLQRFAGYLLFGGNPERLIFFLYGEGRNGKSLFIETLLALFGDYGCAAKADLIGRGRFGRDAESAQPFKMQLRGKRYITASEVARGMLVDAAELKDLTGGDATTARTLHAAPVQFVVTGKIVFRCNHRPRLDSDDQAVWDRVVEIPFNYRVPDDKVDTLLGQQLRTELPGILAWSVRGFLDYRKKGLSIPTKVRGQTQSYRNSMDHVTRWLTECTKPSGKVVRTKAHESYLSWCRDREQEPLTATQFYKNIKDRQGITEVKGNHGERMFKGLRLLEGAK